MKRFLSCMFVLLLITPLYGQGLGPTATIDGPNTAGVGESVWLSTESSEGIEFTWKVIPPSAEIGFTELPVFDGVDENGEPIVLYRAHFESNKTGIYHFIFVVVEDNKSAIAVHELIVGEVQPDPQPDPSPDPDPIPVVDVKVPIPSLPYQNAVKNITPLIIGVHSSVDRVELAKFYMDFADVIERDAEEKISNTAMFREIHMRASQLMFQQTGMQGRYIGLNGAIDKALGDSLGLEVATLNGIKRAEAVKILQAIAWACKG